MPPGLSCRMCMSAPKKGGKTKAKIFEDDSSGDDGCDWERLSLAEDVKRELAPGKGSWHSMWLYGPPFMCGQCNRAVYLKCIYCGWVLSPLGWSGVPSPTVEG